MDNKFRSRTYRINPTLTGNSGVTSYDMTEQAAQVWPSRFQTIAAAYYPFYYSNGQICKQAHAWLAGRKDGGLRKD
jgi:hypothetical protein